MESRRQSTAAATLFAVWTKNLAYNLSAQRFLKPWHLPAGRENRHFVTGMHGYAEAAVVTQIAPV
jgi:hypothetical protein